MRPGRDRNTRLSLWTRRSFIGITVASLRLDAVTEFDLYLIPGDSGPPLLYRERDLVFTPEALQRLRDNQVRELLIPADQNGRYLRYLERNLRAILEDPAVPIDEKSEVVYCSAQGLVQSILQDPRAHDLVSRSRGMVESTVELLHAERNAFEELLKVTSFDYYTHTHSVNVFVFTVALGQRIGYDLATLREVGQGALLHDLGKSQLDPHIINSKGKLTPAQWDAIRRHPVLGYEILREHSGLDDLVLDVARHHHEKLNGAGYPDGLSASSISPYVRITTIADIFDALTTRRAYKGALGSFPALRLMKNEMKNELDRTLFAQFVEMMGDPAGATG